MTKIEWTDKTWNPIVGCSIVSPGCTNCYAMKMAARIEAMAHAAAGVGPLHYLGTTKKVNGNAVWTGKLALAPESTLLEPLRRKKPTMYFVNSMGDLFHEDCPDEWIDRVFAVMACSPQHTFQVLTKRAERMRAYCAKMPDDLSTEVLIIARRDEHGYPITGPCKWPLPNVWLGVSTEDQKRADERIPLLLKTPAAVRFISVEPLIGPVDLNHIPHDYGCGTVLEPGEIHGGTGQAVAARPALDWVIVGGESGANARPMHPQWARAVRDQCDAAGVPFFFKQWGEFAPNDVPAAYWASAGQFDDHHVHQGFVFGNANGRAPAIVSRIGKAKAGRKLDGREHSEWPQSPAARSVA